MKKQTQVVKAARKRERDKGGVGRTESATQGGLTDVDNEADQSQPSLWPIRIKLGGPWQRLGRTVGHKERGGEVGEGQRGRIFW